MKKFIVNLLCLFIPFKQYRRRLRKKLYLYVSNDNNHIYLVSPGGEKKEIFSFKGLNVTFNGKNNTIEIYQPIKKIYNINIDINGCDYTRTIIGKNSVIQNLVVNFFNGNNQQCIIGDEFNCGSVTIFMHENSKLTIRNKCMFSSNITIWTADGHTVFNKDTKKVLNFLPNRDLLIGEHSWIGYGCTIYKNGSLGKNSVLAGSSVLTKKIDAENVVVAGNPAKIIKTNIDWDSMTTEMFKQKSKKQLLQRKYDEKNLD